VIMISETPSIANSTAVARPIPELGSVRDKQRMSVQMHILSTSDEC